MTGEDKSDLNADDQYVEYDVTGKVRKVFSDPARTEAYLKVEFIYDDRGFRLAKVNHETDFTTWYIRDVTGNLISTFEQEGIPTDTQGNPALNSAPLDQTEVPIYGAGKLGVLYPGEDGSTAYEITDHLGNVRALVRDNINIYAATMEDNGQVDYTNPRVQEMVFFRNIFETEVDDANMNHTPDDATIVANPSRSAYLLWQDGVAGNDAEAKAIGPSAALRVNSGDHVELETWVRYRNESDYANDVAVLMLSQLLGSTFAGTGGFEGASVAQTATSFETALGNGGFDGDGSDETRPFAYLNYILFNDNQEMVDAGWQRVPVEAGFDPGEEGLPDLHRRVAFEEPIEVTETGYIYVWVSNESENVRVWFDDLTISHSEIILVQATDYGVWGDVLREQKTDEKVYRYGYQGQFSEKDEETGWNHFELREYDAVIGRWTSMDAANQYWSSYLGMGNDPANGVDPDGAFKTKFGAQWYAFWNGGGDVEQALGGASKGEWYVGKQVDYTGEGVGVAYQRTFDYGNGNKSFGAHVWNHPATRFYIPDFVTVGVGFNGIAISGGGSSLEANWVLRGPEASWKPAITVTQSIGAGYSIDATFNVGGANYIGNVNDITRSMLQTSTPNGDLPTMWGSGGVAAGGKIGVTGTYTPTIGGRIIGRYLNVGAGLPAGPVPVNASGGVSNTWIIYDFHR